MNFADRAVELAGLASLALGWRPAEFWESTPAELTSALGQVERDSELIDRSAVELAGFASMFLGWRPAEFWESTPAELASALGQDGRESERIDRSAVERLRAQFPDD